MTLHDELNKIKERAEKIFDAEQLFKPDILKLLRVIELLIEQRDYLTCHVAEQGPDELNLELEGILTK